MSREDIEAEALRHSSWQDWMAADVFAEAMGDEAAYRLDDASAEPQGREALEAWYEKQWNEARVRARESSLSDTGERTAANADAVDPALLDEDNGGKDSTLWNPDQYMAEEGEEEHAGKYISEGRDERVGQDRPDTGADGADEGNRTGDRSDTVQRGPGDGAAGGTADAGRRQRGGDSGTQNGVVTPSNDGVPPGEKITTSEANRRLTEKLPRVVDDFVQIMGQTLRTNLDEYGAVTEADAEMRVQAGRDKERIYREAHPYIRSLALRLTTGKRLSDTQRRTVMSHITRSLESGATVYRELYTSLTGDKEFASYAENEVEDEGVKGEAQKAARNADGLTAFQRSKLAEKIIDKDIGRRIKTKTAVNGEIADYVERRNEEIKELEKTIDTLKENLEETREKLGEEKGESSRWYRQYQKLEKECAAAERKLKGIEKKLAASRQSRVNQAEKMRAGRKAAEDKMRERLAVQRELVKGLRARMREETQHARLQGRMEIGWKWAEERQKLAALSVERQKRIADRKAAAAYLDACKKASSWIMSSDRIAMNIWVRQRELLLGIQNALFESSKKTAEKRNLAAQIKDVEKKIEKEKRRLTRAKDDASRGAIERNISEYEAFLENLQSSLEYTEVLSPDVSGVKTNQKGEGESEDTVDTGVIVFNGKTMSVEEFREQFYEHKIRYGFMDSKMRAALRGSAPSARTLGEKRKWSAINLARGMSLSDLETVKAVMKQLAIEGRANWERREFAIHFQHREMIQTLLQAQDELRHDKKKTRPIKRLMKALEEKNIEERKKLLSEGHEVERALYGGWDDKRLLQHMDGDRKRALYRFVIRERIKYANRRDIAIEERTKRIMELLGGTEKNEKKHWNV